LRWHPTWDDEESKTILDVLLTDFIDIVAGLEVLL
jgi:hypothetical protein